MKLAAGGSRGSRGFTLLELIVVMSIMMLMIALGVAAFQFYDDEDPFEEPAAKLRQMAKYALHSSALRHQGQSIAFDKGGFGMLGSSGGPGGYYAVPGDMKILIFRWAGKTWEKAEGHVWPFGEQGICEPVKIRFEIGDSSREFAFHPLTGVPVDL